MLLKNSFLCFFFILFFFSVQVIRLLILEESSSYMVSVCDFHLIPERQRKLGQEVLAKEKDQKQLLKVIFFFLVLQM